MLVKDWPGSGKRLDGHSGNARGLPIKAPAGANLTEDELRDGEPASGCIFAAPEQDSREGTARVERRWYHAR